MARLFAHHVGRPLPAELFGDLEPHGLGAFAVERAQVDVDESPAEAVGNLAAQPVDLVVIPRDTDEARAVDGRAEDLGGLEILGNEDAGVEPVAHPLRGDGVRQVAGGRAPHGGHAELARLGEGDRHDPVLERQGGEVHRVVLDVQLIDAEAAGQSRGAHQGGVPDLLSQDPVAVDRQQLAVAPHRSGARGDRLPPEGPAQPVVVVGDLQRPEALLADGARRRLVLGRALPAGQPAHVAHDAPAISSTAAAARRMSSGVVRIPALSRTVPCG